MVTTAAPSLAEYGVTGQKAALQRYLRKQLKRTALFALPGTVIVLLFSRPIIRIIYGRGEFDAASVAVSSQILSLLFLGFVFACLVPLLSSTVYGLKQIRTAFLFIMSASIVHVASAAVLFAIAGLPGLALAASIPRVYNFLGISRYLRTQGVFVLPVKERPGIAE